MKQTRLLEAQKRTFRVVLAEILGDSSRLADEASKRILTEFATLRTELRKAITDSGMRYSERQALMRQLDVHLKNSALRMESAGLSMFDEAWTSGWNDMNNIMMGVPVDAGYGKGGPAYYAPEEFAPHPGFAIEPSIFVHDALLALTTERIVGITEQMRAQVLEQVQIGFLGELSPQEVMYNITNIVGIRDLPYYREIGATGVSAKAENIFRTETMTAHNAAKDEYLKGANEKFPDLKKVWLATGDDRTRDSHIDAHFQVVPVDQPFVVGGQTCEYPLDPILPLRERARCRCTSLPYREGWGPLEELMPDQALLVAKEKERRGFTTPAATARTRNIEAAMKATEGQIQEMKEAIAKVERKYGGKLRAQQVRVSQAATNRIEREGAVRVLRSSAKTETDVLINSMTLMEDAIAAYRLEMQEFELLLGKKNDEIRQLMQLLREDRVNIDYHVLLKSAKTGAERDALIASKELFVDRSLSFVKEVTAGSHEWMWHTLPFEEAGTIQFEALFVDDIGRAYQSGQTTALYSNSGINTQIHELGHILEEFSPHMHARAVEYLEYRRLPGERAKKLSTLTGRSGYKASEKAYADKWTNPYTGKIYKSYGETYATEVISTGIEYLYEDAYQFMIDDPGHFHFTVGLLRGWW